MDGFNPSIFKALSCFASYDGKGLCYMDRYNSMHNEGSRMFCWDAIEGGIECPFYQSEFDTCFSDKKLFEFLESLAAQLEEYSETGEQAND